MIRPALAALVLFAMPANAEDTSMFALYDHFALAQVVGETCTGPTLEEAQAYVDKFAALGDLAEAEAMAQNQDLTAMSFRQFSARRRHSLQASVSQFLATEGCNHAEAKALAAKYAEFQSMDLPN